MATLEKIKIRPISAKNFHHVGYTPSKTPQGIIDIFDNNSVLASKAHAIKMTDINNSAYDSSCESTFINK